MLLTPQKVSGKRNRLKFKGRKDYDNAKHNQSYIDFSCLLDSMLMQECLLKLVKSAPEVLLSLLNIVELQCPQSKTCVFHSIILGSLGEV